MTSRKRFFIRRDMAATLFELPLGTKMCVARAARDINRVLWRLHKSGHLKPPVPYTDGPYPALMWQWRDQEDPGDHDL